MGLCSIPSKGGKKRCRGCNLKIFNALSEDVAGAKRRSVAKFFAQDAQNPRRGVVRFTIISLMHSLGVSQRHSLSGVTPSTCQNITHNVDSASDHLSEDVTA